MCRRTPRRDSLLPEAAKCAKMSGKRGDPVTDNFVSRADGSTGRSDPLVVLPEGVHPAVITTPDRPLSLALISLICAISMV